MNKRCYISGKISGLPKQEYTERFTYASAMVEYIGFTPVSPIELFHPFPFYWGYMFVDILALLTCSNVYFLDNWESSRGARIEYRIATLLNKRIVRL